MTPVSVQILELARHGICLEVIPQPGARALHLRCYDRLAPGMREEMSASFVIAEAHGIPHWMLAFLDRALQHFLSRDDYQDFLCRESLQL